MGKTLTAADRLPQVGDILYCHGSPTMYEVVAVEPGSFTVLLPAGDTQAVSTWLSTWEYYERKDGQGVCAPSGWYDAAMMLRRALEAQAKLEELLITLPLNLFWDRFDLYFPEIGQNCPVPTKEQWEKSFSKFSPYPEDPDRARFDYHHAGSPLTEYGTGYGATPIHKAREIVIGMRERALEAAKEIV